MKKIFVEPDSDYDSRLDPSCQQLSGSRLTGRREVREREFGAQRRFGFALPRKAT